MVQESIDSFLTYLKAHSEMKYDPKSIYMSAIEKYGEVSQKTVAIEELSELIKEICKDLRDQPSYSCITEEIADVYIILEQLKIMYQIPEDDISEYMDAKVERLRRRINKS